MGFGLVLTAFLAEFSCSTSPENSENQLRREANDLHLVFYRQFSDGFGAEATKWVFAEAATFGTERGEIKTVISRVSGHESLLCSDGNVSNQDIILLILTTKVDNFFYIVVLKL